MIAKKCDRSAVLGYDVNEVFLMKIIGTQEELKWVRRALANNCEGCIFEERCNQNASEEQKKHGKTLTSCEEFMARQITFVSEEETKTTK